MLSKSPNNTDVPMTFAFAGTSTVRLAANLTCPHCSRRLHAGDVDVGIDVGLYDTAAGGVRVELDDTSDGSVCAGTVDFSVWLVCSGCHRDILAIGSGS